MGQVEYTNEYIEKVFSLWYEGGRKNGNEFLYSLPPDVDGRTPSKFTIIDWTKTRGWVERADGLDAEISRAADNVIIDKRKKMFEEQEAVADEILKLGLDFLRNTKEGGGIKNDATAIRAIDLALTTKRSVTGAAEAYVKISKMSDDQIEAELKKLLGKPKTDEDNIIEGTAFDTESKS